MLKIRLQFLMVLAIRGNDAQNDQDSVRESVNAWISGRGYF
jgi:hypothetical protein